jgi:hypothetical protein
LNYWIETWNTSGTSTIWVKVPSIPANSTKTIYVYYGNPSATSLSSVVNTFIREIDGAQPLKGSWHFDEGSGTTTYDDSGNGNNGTIYGATWVSGKFKNALSFDGVDDYVDIPTFPSQNKKSITISLWIKPLKEGHGTGWANSDTIIYIGGTSSSIKLGYESTNRILLDGWGQDGGESGVVPLNTWTHVVFVQTSTSWSIYLNGILSYTRTNPYTEDTVQGTVTIGSSLGEMGNYNFNGLIDEVLIYNRALTDAEILDLYNYYGYTTTNYPGRVLVRKYTSPEPTTSVGTEEKRSSIIPLII